METFEQNDETHMKAMAEMQELMQNPEAMNTWMAEKSEQFTALPESA